MFDSDALAVLVGSMLLVRSCYRPVTSLMTWFFGTRYTSLRAFERAYCAKNTIKALVLALLTPRVLGVLWAIAVEQDWEGHGRQIRSMGSIYAATDIVALGKFGRKLPLNTFLHHSCVLVLGVLNLFMDYGAPAAAASPWRHMAVLAGLSIPTYLVNVYLALRRLRVYPRALAGVSLGVYAPFVLCNMAYKGSIVVAHGPSISTVLFGGVVVTIFMDDVKLMSHLWKRMQKGTYRLKLK